MIKNLLNLIFFAIINGLVPFSFFIHPTFGSAIAEVDAPSDFFLHLSSNKVVAGDTLWYKVYTLNASTQSGFSLQLINNKGKIITEQRVKMNNGSSEGAILIPADLNTDLYHILIVLKNPKVPVCTQKLLVLNPENTDLGRFATKAGPIQIVFFPEGGTLLKDIPTKIAFKATQNGTPIDLEGKITDENDREITTIRTTISGLGMFVLKPDIKRKYKVSIPVVDSRTITIPLPETKETGYSFIVNSLKESLNTIVQFEGKNEASSDRTLLMSIQSKGMPYLEVKGILNNNTFISSINKEKLSPGENDLILLDEQRRPLAFRKIYIDKGKRLSADLSFDKEVYSPGEKVKLAVQLNDEPNSSIESDLSVSVTKKRSSEIDISSHFFDSINPPQKREKVMDLLMLTTPITIDLTPDGDGEEFITVTGKLTDKKTGAFVPDRMIHFILPDNAEYFQSKTNNVGNFEISFFDFPGKRTCFVLPEIVSPKEVLTVAIEKNAGFVPADTLLKIDDGIVDFVNHMKKYNHIDSSFRNLSAEVKLVEEEITTASYRYYAKPDLIFNMDDYESFSTLEETIKEVLFVLRTGRRDGERILRIVSKEGNAPFEGMPFIVIDGIPTFNAEAFFKLAPQLINKIEVLNSNKSLAPFGKLGSNGVVNVFTRNSTSDYAIGTTELELSGFSEKMRYIPTASKEQKELNFRKPNFSPLVFWNPSLHTNSLGNPTIEFSLSDELGTFEVKVMGRTTEGIPISITRQIDVQLAE